MAKLNKQLYNKPSLKELRKELRNNLTPAEAKLWTELQKRQLGGNRFRRQYSVGNYILDFYCPQARLALEVDGAIHHQPNQQTYDAERTEVLEEMGITVLRFENKQVFEQLDAVLKEIEEHLL